MVMLENNNQGKFVQLLAVCVFLLFAVYSLQIGISITTFSNIHCCGRDQMRAVTAQDFPTHAFANCKVCRERSHQRPLSPCHVFACHTYISIIFPTQTFNWPMMQVETRSQFQIFLRAKVKQTLGSSAVGFVNFT